MSEDSPEGIALKNEITQAIDNGDILMSAKRVTNENGEEEFHDVEFQGQNEIGTELVSRLKVFLDNMTE